MTCRLFTVRSELKVVLTHLKFTMKQENVMLLQKRDHIDWIMMYQFVLLIDVIHYLKETKVYWDRRG